MGLEAFLSRRRLNLARLCDALTPTVPLKQGMTGVYTLYFMDVCAMISSPHPRRVPVELPNGTVEYIFLQPYLSALYIHFKRELKHEPIWFCEGLPFHERPFFATKIKELCNLYPILLSITSADLDTQASFISVQWLIIRSSIDTHMLDFILTSQGSCVCSCNVSDVSHPVPTIRPTAKDAEIVTYTMQKLSTEFSASTEATFTTDPGSSITPHTNQVVAYQSPLSEVHGSSTLDYNYSTIKQNKMYCDPIDVIDEAIAHGKQIACCFHCGFPILPDARQSRRGITSFLTSFNFRYAPPGASLAQGNTIDGLLLNRLIENPTISAKTTPNRTNSSVAKIGGFDDVFLDNVFINSLQATLPPPLTLLLDTKAELAEFDNSAMVPDNSAVVTINKLQQKSYLSKRSRLTVGHRKSNSGVFVSYHVKKGSTLVSLNNSTNQCIHQGIESFINISAEEDLAQSPCNLSYSYSDAYPVKFISTDAKANHSEVYNPDAHGESSHSTNILKKGISNAHTQESGTVDKDTDLFSKSTRIGSANPFTQLRLESNSTSQPIKTQHQHKIILETNSSDLSTKPYLVSDSILKNSGAVMTHNTSGNGSSESMIPRVSSGIRIATVPSTDPESNKKKTISIIVKTAKKDNLSVKDNQENHTIRNEPYPTSDKPQDSFPSTPPATKRLSKIRKKIDINTYVPIVTKEYIKPDSISLPKMDTSPIRPRSPVSNDELSQGSIIHDDNYVDPIGGDSCSMSGIDDSDEAVSPSNLNSLNDKRLKCQADDQDPRAHTKTPSANIHISPSITTEASIEHRTVSTASLNILTVLRAYHIVTTKKRAIKSKVRNIGPTILEPTLASSLYKTSHYTHMIFRWCLLNEDFLHFIESDRQQRRIATLNPICSDYKRIKDLLGFHGITTYLICMLIRDILNCAQFPDKPSKSRLFHQKYKKKSQIQAPVGQALPPTYYTFYDIKQIISQICGYLYKHIGIDAPDPYTILSKQHPSVFTNLSIHQNDYLIHNLQRRSTISLQHTSLSIFSDPELDSQQDIDVCIDNWLNSDKLQTPSSLTPRNRHKTPTFEPIIYDDNYDINTNIPILAVYHSFNSVFWSNVIRSEYLKDHLLPKNPLFQTIVTTCSTSDSSSLGTTAISLVQNLEETEHTTITESCSIGSQLDAWRDGQVSDKASCDHSDNQFTSSVQNMAVFRKLKSLKTTDDGNLVVRQQQHSELKDLLTTGSVYTSHSVHTMDSTDSSTYMSTSTIPNSIFISSPGLVDLPLYRFLVPDKSPDLDLSYKAFGAGLVNERLIFNSYFYTNKFFIPQPNRLALFNILSVSGGLFMSRDERLSMEAVIRETLACLHLNYYDLDCYYYT